MRSRLLALPLPLLCVAALCLALEPVTGPLPAQAEEPAAEPEALLQQAVAVRRAGDCTGVQELLQPLFARSDSYAGRGYLMAGLYAHTCGEPERAVELLATATGADAEFEDWRLWVLADSALATRRQAVALEALTALLEGLPDSPLRPRAMHRAALLSWELQQYDRTRQLLALSRSENLIGEPGEELEALAWRIAQEQGDLGGQREAARQLLARYPFRAAELRVVELFREPGGQLPWHEILSPQLLLRRGRSLLDAGLPTNALQTLEAVPAEARRFGWAELAAEALVADHRGSEATAVLAGVIPVDDRETSRLEWWRGLAALEAGRQSGRAASGAAQRSALRQRGRAHLERILELGADRELILQALRRLHEEYTEEGNFEAALVQLRHLRRLDPHDTTGARQLWALGWQQYTARNWTGAIGHWAELVPLYGGSSYARAGLYWSARAQENLGQQRRSEEIYRQLLASDTHDFYARQARRRLGGEPGVDREPAPEPADSWPRDPALARAQRLADLELPELAMMELEAVAGRVPERAAGALRARLLHREAQYRPAIRALAAVFPALGTAQQSSVPLEARRIYYPLAYETPVLDHARRQGLPPELVLAIIRQESAFDAAAVSRSGARGLMQIMPATGGELARKLGLQFSTSRLEDPDFSVRLGTTYFRQVLDMFEGNEELALAGYNNGPFRIRRLWREAAGAGRELDLFVEGLQWDETRSYVKRIVIHEDSYRQLYPELDAARRGAG